LPIRQEENFNKRETKENKTGILGFSLVMIAVVAGCEGGGITLNGFFFPNNPDIRRLGNS